MYQKSRWYNLRFLKYTIEHGRQKLVIGHFLLFYSSFHPKKIYILKKKKKNISWGYYQFKQVYHKWQSYYVWSLRYEARQTELFYHCGPFLPFYPTNNSQNQNFQKVNKNTWRYYYFTHMYHKWQSYDEWFLRCGVPRTKCFVILDCFLLFYPPNNSENSNFEKIKKIKIDNGRNKKVTYRGGCPTQRNP